MLDYELSCHPTSEDLQPYALKFSAGDHLYEKGLCDLFKRAVERASLLPDSHMEGFGHEFEVMSLLQTQTALKSALNSSDLPDFSKPGQGAAIFLSQPVSVQEQKKAIDEGIELIDAQLQCIGLARIFRYADESYDWGAKRYTQWVAKSFPVTSKKTGDEVMNTTKVNYALLMSGYCKLSDNTNPAGICGLSDFGLLLTSKKPDFRI
jgi:hypothetical protein